MLESRCIVLQGKKINYTFKRTKRKSIGLKINDNGLIVSAPPSVSIEYVESLLSKKSNWLIKNFKRRENRQSTQLAWKIDGIFPLLGEPWHIGLSPTMQMMPGQLPAESDKPTLFLPQEQIERYVMTWYYKKAITYFSERIVLYAHQLNVPMPPIRLSRAKTRWGSCTAQGVILLNWRLIQMPIHLVDYVVAHELSHLIEMNHSSAFWQLVGAIYPEYIGARSELKHFCC